MPGPLLGLVVVGALVLGGGAVAVASAEGDTAQVVRVIDGDTFEAIVDGRTERVRLLNVDTPETKDPSTPVQCLGPEATAHLETLLAPGSQVVLTYDEELRDKHGRLLAGVENDDDVFVNSDLAARGLGVAELVAPNDRYYGEVLAAQEQARAASVGLYSPQVLCTVPGAVAQVEAQTGAVSATTPEAMDAQANRLAGVALAAGALLTQFDAPPAGPVWGAIDVATRAGLRSRVDGAVRTARSDTDRWRASAVTERARLAEVARVAERQRVEQVRAEERARVEADRRARAEAAAQRQAEKEARDEQRRLDAEAARVASSSSDSSDSSDSSSGSAGSSSGSGSSGYTGPRCYAPGGKTWRPC